MIKTVFLVPTRDNEGRPFTPADWDALDEAILERFDGYTRRFGGEGAWRSGGRVYRDESYEYTISLMSWNRLPAWLDVVRWARQRFRQEAIYIEVAGIPEILTDR